MKWRDTGLLESVCRGIAPMASILGRISRGIDAAGCSSTIGVAWTRCDEELDRTIFDAEIIERFPAERMIRLAAELFANW